MIGNPNNARREAFYQEQRRVFHVYELPETAKVVRLDDLRIPIHFALGRYEAATQEELHDLITDLNVELARRSETGAA